MVNNSTLIAVSEAEMAADGIADLKDRITACMMATRDHWLALDDTERFKAAVAAAIQLSNGEDKATLERSIAALNAVSAMLDGRDADLGPLDGEIIPLVSMWQDAKAA
jgi:hypothetical protein